MARFQTAYRASGARFLTFSILLCLIFAAGYRSASWFAPKSPVASTILVPPTDFAVPLPEGSTEITITDPRADNAEVARFVVQRKLNSIQGLPESRIITLSRASLTFADLNFFRHELPAAIAASGSTWEQALRIRNWLSTTHYKTALPGLATRRPRDAYIQMRQGKPVLCGNLAEIYVALCESAGLIARPVGLSLMVRDGSFGADTHAGAEIWIPEMGGWIYQDPTFNSYWLVDRKPASALQLHNALMEGRRIDLVAGNDQARSAVAKYYVDPRLLFRHISYEYQAGGALLYYVDGRLEPLNMRDKNWVQTDDRAVLENLDTNGNTITERKAEIAPGIFVQLIGNHLFIRDRREQNRGIRVRSSSGTVQVCSYEHWRAEELGVFQGKNLVSNSAFEVTDGPRGTAKDWFVSGPVEVLTTLGGQGMAAQAGGKLWQRVPVEPGRRYVMYARISVGRGVVNWSLADSVRGMDSRGTLRPTQMSEIVSDVVESRSGFLDVSFELAESGGFRVINVILTELPPDAFDVMQRVVPRIESVSDQNE
jgi:hypothetical protein